MHFVLNRKSVVYTWFVSYIIILIIPVVTSMFTYVLSAQTIRNEITSTNQYMLRQVSQDIDNIMRNVEKAYNTYMSNEDVLRLIDAAQVDVQTRQRLLNRILTDVSPGAVLEQDVYQSYIYFKRLEFVLTDSSKYDLEIAHEVLEISPDISMEDWLSTLDAVSEKCIWQQSPDKICIAYPMYSRMFVDNAAVFVAELSQEYTAKIKQSIQELDKAGFLMLMPGHCAILSNGGTQAIPFAYEDIPEGEGIVNVKGEGRDNVVMYKSSSYMDMKYAIMIPQAVFFNKVNYILFIIVIQVVLSLLLGLFFAFWFAKKNYMPVNNILQTISGEEGISEGDNEFDFIQRTVLDKIREIEDAEHKVWRNRDIVFNNMVNKLLSGGMSKQSEFEAFLAEFQITLNSRYFVVMMVKIEDYSEMFAGESGQEDELSSLYVVKVALANIMRELANEQYVSMVSEMDDVIVCVSNVRSADTDIGALADKMQSLIRTYLHVEVSVSISNVHEDFLSIPACYKEASEAMDYRTVLGVGNIIRFAEISPSESAAYRFTVEQEVRIINSVKGGDFGQASAVVEEVLNEDVLRNMPVELCRCLMFDLTSTVMKSINAVEEIAGTHGEIWDTIAPMDSLLSCKSVMEMKTATLDSLRRICEYIQQQRSTRGTRLKEDIVRYVNENYARTDLNVNMIAESFGRNPTYISRYFKEQANIGLLDFINQVRINHAKELLSSNKRISIGEVVEKVGFLNSAALIRVFKKYEGITPGQFREVQKKNR